MGGLQTKATWYKFGKAHFTKPGYLAKKPNWQPDILDSVVLTDKYYMITGANSGIGKEIAQFLAFKGATVYMVCRNADRGKKALEEIKATSKNERVHLLLGDVGVKADVMRIASEFKATAPHLDALVCNAGALTAERKVTPDGNEVTFATHLLYGTYGLGMLLRPALVKCPGGEGRLVAVSSGGMYTQPLDLIDLQNSDDYSDLKAYAKAKRAQICLMEYLGSIDKDITYVSCHPGWCDTPGVTDSMPSFKKWIGDDLRTPWQGAEGIVWLAVAPVSQLRTGEFYLDRATTLKHLPKAKTEVCADKSAKLAERLKAMAALPADATV